jgi:hypothetical protein
MLVNATYGEGGLTYIQHRIIVKSLAVMQFRIDYKVLVLASEQRQQRTKGSTSSRLIKTRARQGTLGVTTGNTRRHSTYNIINIWRVPASPIQGHEKNNTQSPVQNNATFPPTATKETTPDPQSKIPPHPPNDETSQHGDTSSSSVSKTASTDQATEYERNNHRRMTSR